jgi:hypothetical protein
VLAKGPEAVPFLMRFREPDYVSLDGKEGLTVGGHRRVLGGLVVAWRVLWPVGWCWDS